MMMAGSTRPYGVIFPRRRRGGVAPGGGGSGRTRRVSSVAVTDVSLGSPWDATRRTGQADTARCVPRFERWSALDVQQSVDLLVVLLRQRLQVGGVADLGEELLHHVARLHRGPARSGRGQLGGRRRLDERLRELVVTQRGGVLRVRRAKAVLAEHLLVLLREHDLQERLRQSRLLGLRRD